MIEKLFIDTDIILDVALKRDIFGELGEIIFKALESNFKDFEDSIQNETAAKYKMDYLITRNLKDYKYSQLKVLSPEEFIKIKIEDAGSFS